MSVEISQFTLSRLDDDVPEIKLRALNTVEDVFKNSGPNLENLDVDPYKLIKCLVGWLHRKPVQYEDRVLQLIIAILKSKYKLQVIPVLSSDAYKDIFKEIGRTLVDRNHRQLFQNILRIINEYLEREERFISGTSMENLSIMGNMSREDCGKTMVDIVTNKESSESFSYTCEWDVPGAADLNSIKSMKTSLHADNNDDDIEHALKFFGVVVDDFPAEYFLQPPYIFTSLTDLIDAKERDNRACALNAVLDLTKSVSRRMKIRKLSKMHIFRDPRKHVGSRKQVTIGTYCQHVFKTILNLLQDIYTTSKLDQINLSFLVLVEIVDLICLDEHSIRLISTENHYINGILKDLGFFLKYIRELANSDNKQNNYKTYRNNSIILIYAVCRLIMFRDGYNGSSVINLTARTQEKLLEEVNSACSKMTISAERRLNGDESGHGTWRSKHAGDEAIWRKELEIAALDFPLKQFYPDVHDLLLTALEADSFHDECTVKVLLNADEALRPAVTLLKDAASLKKEQLIFEGLKAVEVFSIIQSVELVKRLFEEIVNLAGKYDGNEGLRKQAEKLLLRLFCHENGELKRLTYRMASDRMTAFFGDLMSGAKFISKSYATNISLSKLLGLPLTIDILIEVICFGLTNSDEVIASKAENILTLVLRSKFIIPDYWERVCEILVPVLGLLQCFVRYKGKSGLGDLIFQLSEPDDRVNLPQLIHIIEANVRLLFSRERRTREEALCRLSYILMSDANAKRYIPNIDTISELLPNNICIADHIYESQRGNFNEIYERSYINPMIKLLSSSDVEPSIRRTTLIQLNVMLQDPVIADHFYNANGLKIILDILKQSLVKVAVQNYADNVIPIVGILTKLCLQKPHARRIISGDVDAYVMLLRALFINHLNETFKMDCSIVLFLASFSEFVIGSNQLSLPNVCQRILVPIKCDYHWTSSAFDYRSPLERLVAAGDKNDDGNALRREQPGIVNHEAKKKIYWQYIRMAFASLWFGSLEVVLGVKTSEDDSTPAKPLKYTTSNNNRPMIFNQQLHLNEADLKAIEVSCSSYGVAHWVTELQNATTHNQVNMACAAIENFLNIDSTGNFGWDFNSLSSAIHRYADITPKSGTDEQMFCSVLHLLRTMAERGIRNAIEWFWKSFNKKNCVFLDILCKDSNWSSKLYAENAQFIEITLARFIECGAELIQTSSNKAALQKNEEEFREFFERIFERVHSILDDTFTKRDLEKLRCQLSLLRVISSSMQIHSDDYTASFFANKLLRFVIAIKSLSQAGSSFNKNCLLTIGNVMLHVDELKLDKKHLNLLSSLCGHMDPEIRAFSWCILSKVSQTLRGAETLIRELSSLPGGFHACCLSTLLDIHEPSIVRENAAYTFATLISYCDESNNLSERVYPRCSDSGLMPMAHDPSMIFYIIKQHNFYKDLVVALKNFCPTEIIDFNVDTENVPITSCDLVRSFCVVLASIAGLNSRLDSDILIEIAIEIMRLVPLISNSVNKSSALLLTEICTFLCHYLVNNRELLERVAAQEVYLIRSLVSLLDISLYDDIRKDTKTVCWSQIMCLLRLLARTSYGFCAICNSFDVKSFPKTFYFTLNCLAYPNTVAPVLKLCTTLFIVGQQENDDFQTFSKRLDNLFIDEKTTNCLEELCSDDDEEMQNFELLVLLKEEKKYASEVLFDYWNNVFQHYKQTPNISESVFKAMAALLKCSHLARAAATTNDLLPQLIDDLEEIHESIGSNCNDFIRRHGNAKLEKVLQKIKNYCNIILNWYSMEILQDPAIISRLLRVFIHIWPWVSTSNEMLHQFMKLLATICEDSLPVCKAMTAVVVGNSQSMLQLVATYCTKESVKVKYQQSNLDVLDLALLVLSNCCACFEGRNQIYKLNILDTLSRFHPSVTKQQKQYHKITLLWLRFFEIYTRHSDINIGARHLNMLRSIFEHGHHEQGLRAMEILRNMSFNVANRSSLLVSDDFLHTIKLALDTNSTYVHLLAVTSIWKLVTQNFRARQVIKSTNIYHKISKLNEQMKKRNGQPMKNEEEEENRQDLVAAIEYVMKILTS